MGTTPNYGWEYPDVGSDVDTWGGIANNLYIDVDAQVKTVADAALVSLPTTGGTMTGDIVLPQLGSSSAAVAGFKGAPFNSQGGNYTFVLSDQGKAVYHTSATPHTWTIPPNSSVAYPIGAVINILNPPTSGALSLVRGAGVALYLALETTNADHSIVNSAFVQLIKYDTNAWIVTGYGAT